MNKGISETLSPIYGRCGQYSMEFKYYIIVTLTLCCCGKKEQTTSTEGHDIQPVDNTEQTASTEREDVQPVDNSEKFLSLFKEFEPSIIHIYAPSLPGVEPIDSLFNGQQIDVTEFEYPNNEGILRNRRGLSKIFAVGKFEIDENTLALLFRELNQHSDQVIQLTFWDKSKKEIIKGTDLAELYGDDFGWYFDKESWINYKPGTNLEIITRRKDTHYDDGLDLTAETDSLFKQVCNNRSFIQVGIIISDTVRYPLKRPPYIRINPDEYN